MTGQDGENAESGTKTETTVCRIGVYICHCGGNISDVVDVEKVVQSAAKLPDVVVARRHMFMCSDPGQNMIADDIREKKLGGVVVASCSPSLHELTFRQTLGRSGLNPYLYEHANIREQVSWVSKSDPHGATDKAIRLVAAAVAKVRLLQPLEPLRVEAKQHIVVIGGGVSGLRCAQALSQRGFAVSLLERSPFLGGRAAQLGPVYPTRDEARDLLCNLCTEISKDRNITVYTSAEVAAISGYVGSFHLKVYLHPRGVQGEFTPSQTQAAVAACPVSVPNEFDYGLSQRKAIYLPYSGCYPLQPAIDWEVCTRCGKCVEAVGEQGINLAPEPQEMELNAGAIVLATGFDPYSPRRGEYGYMEYPEVITLPQVIRLLDKDGPTGGKLELNGRSVKNVCLIHCVGSRQVEGIHEPQPDGQVNNYCSRVCCTATLQLANEIRERFPEVNVFDFYQDIRTYGRGHEDYYDKAANAGDMFFRYVAEEPPVVVKAEETTNNAPLLVKAKDTLTFGEEVEVPADLVVLSVGIVPRDITGLIKTLKLPRGQDRFLQEVHPKLRPVELAVSGVLIAGTCQGPMDITESCATACAAAGKATDLLAKGYIELDPFVARVDSERCQGEGFCVQECKFQHALSFVEREINGKKLKQAQVNAALCNGCGMCAAVCPHGAIQVDGWRLDQFEAMVDAVAADY